jgi:hypothetical protein
MRPDEVEVPVRLGDAPPLLPFRKPFDLNAWQLPLAVLTAGLTLNLEQILPLSDAPFQTDSLISPMLLARLLVLLAGSMVVFIQPGDRLLPVWLWVMLKHFWRAIPAVYADNDDGRGPSYFPADADAMVRMNLRGEGTVFVVDPPYWRLLKRTPLAHRYWQRHVPYRMLLPVEAQGSLEMMTDEERAARWQGFAVGLKALEHPVQIVAQTRPEDPNWLAERAMPPASSPFRAMRWPIQLWALERAVNLMQRRIIVTCSAAEPSVLTEHVRDVAIMLAEAGLSVREIDRAEQRDIFDQVYGSRAFFPHSVDSYGIDKTNWVTLVIRRFPRNCVVGWVMFVIGQLPVDVALYCEPDDGKWVTKIMEWFEGMCDLPTADTAHRDAMLDCQRVEGKLKRNEDSVQRATMLLTMPLAVVPRVSNRLRKAGAIFREARWEHQPGRLATLPMGGMPRIGVTRPYDGESVAACYPFGSSGLRSNGMLLGTARDSNEAVTLDLLDQALNAAMVVILGTTGAGKTFLMQLMIERSGLPFVIVDMKLHLDATRHGDFYRFVKAAGGDYHVCRAGEPLPEPHPFAQCYNLASLSRAEQVTVLHEIAEQEWARALDTLEDRIFAIDEGNLLGQTEAGREFIERVVSQGRSVGFIGICATQEVTDFLANQRMAKAVTMSSMQFVLAQEFSNVDTVADALKLGGDARAELRKFQPQPGDTVAATSRSAIMRVGQRMCSLRIEASPEEVNLFTTKPSDKRAMREAREEELAWSR